MAASSPIIIRQRHILIRLAYLNGGIARRAGEAADINPWSQETVQFVAWAAGWWVADALNSRSPTIH
jgi:hypothetical protein